MKQQVYEEALRAIIKLGDELITETWGWTREAKAAAYVLHADAVEKIAVHALGEKPVDFATLTGLRK